MSQDSGKPGSDLFHGDPRAVRGIVTAAGWDDTGRPTSVMISSTEEQEFLVNPEGMGRELLGHTRREIEVVGRVMEEAGIKRITVESYSLLGPR